MAEVQQPSGLIEKVDGTGRSTSSSCETLPVPTALAGEVCGLGQRAVGGAFGVSPYAVSKAIARVRELAGRRGTAQRLIRSLTSNLNG